jgi:hypothetical protein
MCSPGFSCDSAPGPQEILPSTPMSCPPSG